MRVLLSLLIFPAMLIAMPAKAQEKCPPLKSTDAPIGVPIVPGFETSGEVAAPAPLAPLAADSPWHARLEAAADELFAALRSRDINKWRPLLGGRWLSASDQRAVEMLLADPCGAFAAPLSAAGPVERRILGWTIPAQYSAADREEIRARRQAEALVCWAAPGKAEPVWPRTAAEADNARGRPYACARIAYSLAESGPGWRAFIE